MALRSMVRVACAVLAGGLFVASAVPAREASAPAWVRQEASTPRFQFEVLAMIDGDRAAVRSVRVLARPDGALVQEVVLEGDLFYGGAARLLRIVDANFDGHPDFSIPQFDGGAGPNSSHAWYLFDPAAGQFVFNAFLSELPQAVVGANGTIESASRGGCCQHSATTWRYVGGRYVLAGSVEQSYSHDGKWIDTSTCVLRQGKMRCNNKRTRQPRVPG